MTKTTMTVEGMMCGMCEAHVCDAIRNNFPSAKKVSASRSKNEASFISEEPIDEDALKDIITKTGYDCTSISSEPYKKKGLFGRK